MHSSATSKHTCITHMSKLANQKILEIITSRHVNQNKLKHNMSIVVTSRLEETIL